MERFFSPNSGEDKKNGLHQKWNAFFPNSGEDQKKGLHPKMERFFSPMHTRVKLLGGDADEDHTQIIGGDTVKLLKGVHPIPPGFRHPCFSR